MWAWLKGTLMDGEKPSYSRAFALPFLASSFGLALADGVMSLIRRQSALDAAGSLAVMGITLFTGSKALSIRGKNFTGAVGGGEAPEAIPQATKNNTDAG